MDTTTLAAFLAVDLLLVFTPGADWAYAISAGLRERSVVPAVTGLIAGHAAYALVAVAGLAVIVASSPAALTWRAPATCCGWAGVFSGSRPHRRPLERARTPPACGSCSKGPGSAA
jgi:hypothetical protein